MVSIMTTLERLEDELALTKRQENLYREALIKSLSVSEMLTKLLQEKRTKELQYIKLLKWIVNNPNSHRGNVQSAVENLMKELGLEYEILGN